MMKIMYLVHQFYPYAYTGTEKFVLQLAQRCQSAGHTVQIVTYNWVAKRAGVVAAAPGLQQRLKGSLTKLGVSAVQLRQLPQRFLPNRIQVNTYHYQDLPVIAFAHRRRPGHFSPEALDRNVTDFARELLQRERPDLLHVGHAMRCAEFLPVAAELGIPYLLTLTDFWVLCPNCKLLNEKRQLCAGPRGGQACQHACPSFRKPYIQRRLEQNHRLLQGAATVVAPSHFLAEKIQAEFGPLPITIIPYGIDADRLKPQVRRYPAPTPLVFFFASALLETKGVHLLLQAFQSLASGHVRLLIYGSGPLVAAVQAATQRDQRITYGGVYQMEQLPALLHQADVVIVPSAWHENMPLIMQEAQACGVPTLVSDVGGMTECVTDGVNGFTFRVGDVEDLRHKLQMIVDQPERLNQIKENIRNPKAGQYRVTSLAEEADLYLTLYEKIYDGTKSVNF